LFWFGLGFTLVFILLGAAFGLLGAALIDLREILTWAAVVVLILGGLIFLFPERVPARLQGGWAGSATSSRVGLVFAGAGFASAWSPCIGPALGTALTLAAVEGSVLRGTILLAVFSLGMLTTFGVMIVLLERWRPSGKTRARLHKIAGAVMIITALALATGYLQDLSQELSRYLPLEL
jgi:cytochrome c-type biogenesis protein